MLHLSFIIHNYLLLTLDMENTQVLDLVAAGLAIAIFIGGYLMMFTDILTRKKNK